MENSKKEGENYLKPQHLTDASMQSPAEKKKSQQEDINQNNDELTPNPEVSTNLGNGHPMEGGGEVTDRSIDSE
jgi:hypothetical protein